MRSHSGRSDQSGKRIALLTFPGSALVSSAGDVVSTSRTFRRRTSCTLSCALLRCVFGSAGCQPAVAGSLPATLLAHVISKDSVAAGARQVAEPYRLAACAPQKKENPRVLRSLVCERALKFVSATRRNQHSRRVRYPRGARADLSVIISCSLLTSFCSPVVRSFTATFGHSSPNKTAILAPISSAA